jgi:hypothetical protein
MKIARLWLRSTWHLMEIISISKDLGHKAVFRVFRLMGTRWEGIWLLRMTSRWKSRNISINKLTRIIPKGILMCPTRPEIRPRANGGCQICWGTRIPTWIKRSPLKIHSSARSPKAKALWRVDLPRSLGSRARCRITSFSNHLHHATQWRIFKWRASSETSGQLLAVLEAGSQMPCTSSYRSRRAHPRIIFIRRSQR